MTNIIASILLLISMGSLAVAFLTGIYQILSWLRDKDYSPSFKLPILFFLLYVVFYIPTFILIN
ncbi:MULTISPECIES: hypothetical protein [unclassified Staphylococcus]|uniref:hypothetical protein n=1 Tax=unclassified Staphylococcus TaxID=91994 RepID=UPI00187E0858|nr:MULTISPECIES: hypothetical protein [unclassified Staphylococcus]MBF2757560.1 hypothetical protein [Staphylococcus haemolyticus]MBF2774890.1 hypothetical protein [Staphylococcus haemolyticus]MBF2777169.1 hypothetical protein [Staphylococcus haemolyticus]MBF2816640.1 hypothetical protein [Staphylococcus haemolyticus]MBF9719957.1 hypothetical protein [Staphylococcus haemolyticus]